MPVPISPDAALAKRSRGFVSCSNPTPRKFVARTTFVTQGLANPQPDIYAIAYPQHRLPAGRTLVGVDDFDKRRFAARIGRVKQFEHKCRFAFDPAFAAPPLPVREPDREPIGEARRDHLGDKTVPLRVGDDACARHRAAQVQPFELLRAAHNMRRRRKRNGREKHRNQ